MQPTPRHDVAGSEKRNNATARLRGFRCGGVGRRSSVHDEDPGVGSSSARSTGYAGAVIDKWSSILGDNLPNTNGRVYSPDLFKKVEFDKPALPPLHRIAPANIAHHIVSVQPMTRPIGGLAFYTQRYAEQKKTPLQELTERVWADHDETDNIDREAT